PVYDNEIGCLMCTLNMFPDCSSDNFAIRPERIEINSTDPSYPDLLRAGKNYDLTLNAYNVGTTTNTMQYDQLGFHIESDNLTKYYANGGGVVAAGAPMEGNGTLSNTFVFANGVTTSPAQFSYSDVGDIGIHLEDRDWAFVDLNNSNDTTPHDCSAHGAYICGDRNATFIPDHFKVIVDLNNSSSNFTYLSNDQNMTAHLKVKVYAENENNITTKNFTMPAYGHTYYDNPMTVKMTIPDNPTLGAADLNQTDTPILLEFDHGFKELTWNDTNETLAHWFHYPRATNLPVNPFVLYGNEVDVDVNSTYVSTSTPPASEGTAYIDGTDSDDNNITYVYGRVHSPRYRAMCSGAPCSANVTFFYELYADKDANATLITTLLGNNKQRSIDSVNWYRNSEHNTSTDGNVTYTTQNVPGTPVQTTFSYTTQTSWSNYQYDGIKGFPYKGSITIPQSLTSGIPSWLIYDKYNAGATQVQSELEFYGPGEWSSDTGADTSVKDTGTTNRNQNTNRRIRW
ncbi:MAG: hypothetical protein MUP09_06620, partial [Thiovulaceae bacterium]|nr:hypothetical protein [Sulfurimonadaceae bacterium]